MDGFIRSFVCGDPSQSDSAMRSVCGELENDRMTVQDVVEKMEPFLTSEKEQERGRVSYMLSQLLSSSVVALSPSEIHLFVVFFSHRLSDSASAPSSIQALHSLVARYGLSFDPACCDYMNIIGGINSNFRSVQHPQSVRKSVYELIIDILNQPTARIELRTQSEGLIEAIMSAIDGEKDPRCLMIAFQALHETATIFSNALENPDVCEKVVDILTSYFPISFSSSVGVENITSDKLSSALQKVLCRHEGVTKICLPFLVEQIHSGDDLRAKTEGFVYVSEIVKYFGLALVKSAALEAHSSSLSHLANLLFDISISEGSVDILDHTMALVNAINFAVCKDLTSVDESDWNDFQARLLARTTQELDGGTDNMKARMAWKLCISLANSGGFVASQRVLATLLPVLLHKLALALETHRSTVRLLSSASFSTFSSSSPEHVLNMLTHLINVALAENVDTTHLLGSSTVLDLSSILELVSKFYTAPAHRTEEAVSPHKAVVGEILRTMRSALRATQEILKRISVNEVSNEVWQCLVSSLLEFHLGGPSVLWTCDHASWSEIESSEPVCSELLRLWEQLASNAALDEVVHRVVVDPLFADLQRQEVGNPLGVSILAAVARGSLSTQLVRDAVAALREALCKSCGTLRFAHKLLRLLIEILQPLAADKRQSLFCVMMKSAESANEIVFSLLPRCVTGRSLDEGFAQNIRCFIRLCFEISPVEAQSEAFASLFAEVQSRLEEPSAMELLLGALAHLDRSCAFFSEGACVELALELLRIECAHSSPVSTSPYPICLGVLIQKLTDAHMELVSRAVFDSVSSPSSSATAVHCFFWATKGLLMRPRASAMQLKAIGLLGDIVVGATNSQLAIYASQHMHVLFFEHPFAFPRADRFNLWKQKLFTSLFPRIRVLPGDAPSIADASIELTLSKFLVFCELVGALDPAITLSSDSDQVVEMLLHVIARAQVSRNDLDAAIAKLHYLSLNALDVVLASNPSAVRQLVEHLETVVLFLEKMTKAASTAKARALALQCLSNVVTVVAYPSLFPHRSRVIKSLTVALDDKKRGVRVLASKVRNQWIMLR